MFLINQNGHFFEIKTDEVPIDLTALKDCTLFETNKALLEAVCELHHLELDEVEGGEMVIQANPTTGEPECIEGARGMSEMIEGDVATYINEFSL